MFLLRALQAKVRYDDCVIGRRAKRFHATRPVAAESLRLMCARVLPDSQRIRASGFVMEPARSVTISTADKAIAAASDSQTPGIARLPVA